MKHNIPLKSLYSFIAVAETGSMVKAADSIHVSHSAISQAIKSLEQQLEVKLFDRVGRQVYLNDAGETLLSARFARRSGHHFSKRRG